MGIVFDIQRFSLHDGPGIRTIVFLKGCALRCEWCANPESQRFAPEILYDPGRCIGCGNCIRLCKQGAVYKENGRILYNRKACLDCGECASECYVEARVVKGQRMEVGQVVDEILKDEAFYIQSGGGMTLGGGEPLEQSDFSADVLYACKEKAIHTAVETAGNVSWANFERVIPFTDLFLFDLKHIDAEILGAHTRADALLVLSNLEKLAGGGGKIIVRIPVIPSFNDTPEVIGEISRFAGRLGLSEVHLLPYHRYGQGKYRLLGRIFPFKGPEQVSEKRINQLRDAVEREGLRVRLGG